MIEVNVTTSRRGDLARRVEEISRAVRSGRNFVKVGLPAGRASGDVIAYAGYNHFGTSRGIPPRPFIRLAIWKGRGQIAANFRQMVSALLQGRGNVEQGLSRIAIFCVGLIQDQISSSTPPPNDPGTIRKKGSSTTLIDTGRMRQSITWDWA